MSIQANLKLMAFRVSDNINDALDEGMEAGQVRGVSFLLLFEVVADSLHFGLSEKSKFVIC